MKNQLRQISRRQWLAGMLATAGVSFLPFGMGRRAFADDVPTTRRFVFLYVPGGWDQLLFLDPREFAFAPTQGEYDSEAALTGIEPGYHYGLNGVTGLERPVSAVDANFYFGPAARGYSGYPTLTSLMDDGVPMAIVRGINMGTLGHQTGYLYFLTGERPKGAVADGASIPIRIATQMGDIDAALGGTVTPTLALALGSYSGDKPGRYGALQATTVDDLSRLLVRPETLQEPAAVEAALSEYAGRPLGEGAARYDREGLLSALAGASVGAREMLADNLGQSFDIVGGTTDAAVALRAHYGIDPSNPDLRRVRAAVVSLALRSNFAQFISTTINGGGDTHGSGNAIHSQGLSAGLFAVTQLIDELRSTPAPQLGGTWMDHTTICMFSEIARTPRFNAKGGRDHHFTNSCLLIGAGVQGGRVVGASSETGGMVPVPYDFDEQQVLAAGQQPSGAGQRNIIPDDIGATLLASASLPYGEYRDARPLWGALTVDPF